MSYSIVVVADTKAEVMKKIAAELDAVVYSQQPHAADKDAALATAEAFVNLLVDPHEGNEISVHMHGSLSWKHDAPEHFTGAGVGVNAIVRSKVIV